MFGIVIITFNSEAEIGACLDAAQSTGAEIVVVDNASQDRTREQIGARPVHLIANSRNRGFAAAANQGVAFLKTPFVLLLNPDAVLIGGWKYLVEECSRAGIGGAGGQLLARSGQPQTGFMVRRFPTPLTLCFEALLLNRLWPGNPVNRRYRCLDLAPSKPATVDQPAGAFFLIRRNVWEELDGFDESFFPLWFEDVDFCKRMRDTGYLARYVPTAVAKHTGAHSIGKISLEMRQVYWYGSLLKYAAKHFSPAALRTVCLAVICGSILRMSIGVIQIGGPRTTSIYGRVIRLAAREFMAAGKTRKKGDVDPARGF